MIEALNCRIKSSASGFDNMMGAFLSFADKLGPAFECQLTSTHQHQHRHNQPAGMHLNDIHIHNPSRIQNFAYIPFITVAHS